MHIFLKKNVKGGSFQFSFVLTFWWHFASEMNTLTYIINLIKRIWEKWFQTNIGFGGTLFYRQIPQEIKSLNS